MDLKQLGPFTIERKLGAGGMGVVFRALHPETNRHVAIKVLNAELADNERLNKRFDRELKILRELRHPNIVRCYGGGQDGTIRYYVMELVEGGSLSRMLRKRGPLPWNDVVEYGLQICAALQHAHEHGIIHRDVKPANLLIGKDGKLKLSDFGIARDLTATGLTAAGNTVGTYTYMAPEQIRGESSVSHKSDLYSLGCILFELLTGKQPFEADSIPTVLYKHLEDTPPRVSTMAMDCPIWLDTLICRLLEKEAIKRPHDAAAVATALLEIRDKVTNQASVSSLAVTGQPSAFESPSGVGNVRKILRKGKKRKSKENVPLYERTSFLLLCLVLVGGVIGYSFWPASESSLFAQAKELMGSEDRADWSRARREFLLPLLERFPQGQHAAEARDLVDQIEMDDLETRIKVNSRLNRPPDSEEEAQFAKAFRYELFGDRITALEQYHAIVNLLKDDEDSRVYMNLAKRQIRQIEESGGTQGDRRSIVQDAIDRAKELMSQGESLEAKKILSSIISLYGDNREVSNLVKTAELMLLGEKGVGKEKSESGPNDQQAPPGGENTQPESNSSADRTTNSAQSPEKDGPPDR